MTCSGGYRGLTGRGGRSRWWGRYAGGGDLLRKLFLVSFAEGLGRGLWMGCFFLVPVVVRGGGGAFFFRRRNGEAEVAVTRERFSR